MKKYVRWHCSLIILLLVRIFTYMFSFMCSSNMRQKFRVVFKTSRTVWTLTFIQVFFTDMLFCMVFDFIPLIVFVLIAANLASLFIDCLNWSRVHQFWDRLLENHCRFPCQFRDCIHFLNNTFRMNTPHVNVQHVFAFVILSTYWTNERWNCTKIITKKCKKICMKNVRLLFIHYYIYHFV